MIRWKNALLISLSASAVFSLLYLTGFLTPLEDRLYDAFLRFRANRQRIDNVVFLDVDDTAIAYNGFYPWPRSIPADGLLRLKEFGAAAAILDIEYIDHGPQGVDSLYLNQGLGNDFERSFSGINSQAADLFSAIKNGRIPRTDIDHYTESFLNLISDEHKSLYAKAQSVARDNDRYLAQTFALNGNVWSTLNLRKDPLDGEQAERRPIAEEYFSYPVEASDNASQGAGFIDILPALPIFAESSKGAGFTNVEIDNDGVRRRIYLAQNIHNHWYLQLAFAPLVDYLGSPQILLEKQKLTIKQAKMPDGRIKDIVVPLDKKGRMMLDWSKKDYFKSYTHVSFAEFSLMNEIEADLERYARALALTDVTLFTRFDSSLSGIPVALADIGGIFDSALSAKTHAVENSSDDSFDAFLEYRNLAYSMLAEIIELDTDTKVRTMAAWLSVEYPDNAEYITSEADYISQLINALEENLTNWNELNDSNTAAFNGKFCIIGRSDTGTTDYGANPFYSEYVNVGTHAVVMDTILSETFIIPLSYWRRILFMMIFIPLFFLFSGRLPPVSRTVWGFASAIIVVIAGVLLFRFTGFFWGPLGFVFAMISAVIIREVISYAGSEKEKQFIRTAFSTYVSSDVVKEIISDPSRLQLGGTKRRMTAIFTDVKSFSTISEKLDPEDLVSLLNNYLSAMSDIILKEKGTIDKYEGDAIIAFFGAPLDLEDHALRACVSAIAMKKIEAQLNKKYMENNLSPIPLLTRIGINTGYMVAGNMGTENKMNYTIMGNAVNLAARLEGVNKQYGTWILASEDTVRETGQLLLTRKLDRVRVVGIDEPVRLYELIELAENADEQQKKLTAIFHEALDNFEKRSWKQAAEGFKEALAIKIDDPPSKIYLERCEQFINIPPEDSWDGVYNLTSK